ncbi:MAG: hypothetical protein O2794_03545 [bacterium]|nr:hypothetical protein [bacterium]
MAKQKPFILPKNHHPRTTWEIAQLFGMSRREHDKVIKLVAKIVGKKKK